VSPGKFIVSCSIPDADNNCSNHSRAQQTANTDNLQIEHTNAKLGRKRKTNGNNPPTMATSKKQKSTGAPATPTQENTIKQVFLL
jgi:hypothetical protein